MSKPLWTQRRNYGPPPRMAPAMAYDSARGRVVLFGGVDADPHPTIPVNSLFFGDTWEWDGDNWTQVSDIGPPPRRHATMAYDEIRRRMILFGGEIQVVVGTRPNRSIRGIPFGDTWEWNGENWTQLDDAGPTRTNHAMAYDRARAQVILYGGLIASGEASDTWRLDAEKWTLIEDTGPGPRSHHAIAFDGNKGSLVLFGGKTPNPTTWEWNGVAWTQVSEFGLAPRSDHAMTDDGKGGVLLFGGMNADRLAVGDTWGWDGRFWTQRQDIGPGARANLGLAHDAKRDRFVLFGGVRSLGSQYLGDTWESS